ncbi:hypothetical protein JTE90_018527, partial [Oedothorax gibbosus]
MEIRNWKSLPTPGPLRCTTRRCSNFVKEVDKIKKQREETTSAPGGEKAEQQGLMNMDPGNAKLGVHEHDQ